MSTSMRIVMIKNNKHNPYPCDISDLGCRQALGLQKRAGFSVGMASSNPYPCDINDPGCRAALGLKKRNSKIHAETRYPKRVFYMKRASRPNEEILRGESLPDWDEFVRQEDGYHDDYEEDDEETDDYDTYEVPDDYNAADYYDSDESRALFNDENDKHDIFVPLSSEFEGKEHAKHHNINEGAHRHHNPHKDMTALADAMGVDQGYSVALPANFFGKRSNNAKKSKIIVFE